MASCRCDEPGTRPLLMLLRCALRPPVLKAGRPPPSALRPFGGTDALGLRRLLRSLQLLATPTPTKAQGTPGTATCSRRPLLDPRAGPGRGAGSGGGARQARRQAARGGPGPPSKPEAAPRTCCGPSGTPPASLMDRQQVTTGGPARGSRGRDLDMVLALFDQAGHFADSMPPGAPSLFSESLAGQEIMRRHAGRAGGQGGLRPHPDRAPVQGHQSGDVVVVAGVPGRDLARPAAARIPAGRRALRGGAPWRSPRRDYRMMAGQRARRGRGRGRAWPPSCWPRNVGCST